MAIIETRDLSFRYDEQSGLALDGVNLSIEEGSFTAVLGNDERETFAPVLEKQEPV